MESYAQKPSFSNPKPLDDFPAEQIADAAWVAKHLPSLLRRAWIGVRPDSRMMRGLIALDDAGIISIGIAANPDINYVSIRRLRGAA